MSRIAGIVSPGRAERERLIMGMMRELLSRSRCDSVLAADASTHLGWCGSESGRLASRDRVSVVLDGTIYNHRELAPAPSDAELILLAYRQYGFAETLERLNGDFAIALWDGDRKTLWLGRDRFGVKPLYYASGDGWFAFASRPRPLFLLSGGSPEVDPGFVALYAASHYRFVDNDPHASPYRGIKQLPAGHMLEVGGTTLRTSRYWSLAEEPDFSEDPRELAGQYRDLLRDAVRLRLKRAGRPAFTLSGGMDSSSVLALARDITGERQHAFSAVYDDPTYDESADIKPMLEEHALWHPVSVGAPDLPRIVEEMIELHDQPVATATWLSHFILAQEVKKQGFGSLFGGLGGDELNAGEYEYFFYFFADLAARGERKILEREIAAWARHHDHLVFRKSAAVAEAGLRRLVDLKQPGRCLPNVERLHRYRSALNPDYFRLETVEPIMDHPFRSYLKNRTFQDLFRETIPCCLRAEDRQTTPFGIGNIAPFFDHRLAEFMFRIPGALKIKNGVTKILLREAMAGILPEETRMRVKKTGWNAPAHQWFSGPGRELLLDLIHSRSFRERGVYNIPEVLRLIDDHEEIVARLLPEENHMMFLWQLLNLEVWFRWVERLPARAH